MTPPGGDLPPGWHGKLPTLGDFATRRLPPAFVEAWDGWLAGGLQALQRRADWPQAYLDSPSWRFLLMPGALPAECGDLAWVGVLMPSVDRVGRYYPLTLAQPLAALPHDAASFDALWRWLLRLDEAAADALHEDWSVDAMEAELQRLGPAPHDAPGEDGSAACDADVPVFALAASRPGGARALFAAQAASAWARRWQGRAFWYADADLTAPRLLGSRGLEPHALLPRLLGGVDASLRSA